MSNSALVKMVDHTLLSAGATRDEVDAAVAEAAVLGAKSVCLSPASLPVQIPAGLLLTVVVGFPSGKHQPVVKAMEAALAVSQGADEIDMVIDVGAALEGRFDDVRQEIALVRSAVPVPTVLKVIIESAALNDTQIVGACQAAESAGADFVKTSTGFHPAGGATPQAVALMANTVGGRLGVKASGGIRSREAANAMITAGATRLGLSGTRAVVTDTSPDSSTY